MSIQDQLNTIIQAFDDISFNSREVLLHHLPAREHDYLVGQLELIRRAVEAIDDELSRPQPSIGSEILRLAARAQTIARQATTEGIETLVEPLPEPDFGPGEYWSIPPYDEPKRPEAPLLKDADPELERLLDEEDQAIATGIVKPDWLYNADGSLRDNTTNPYPDQHPCTHVGCEHTVLFDDEPWCYTHSPDSGSSVRGYSYVAAKALADAHARAADQIVEF